jgi:uncharacterized protein YoxC
MDIMMLILFIVTWIFIIINFIISDKAIDQLNKVVRSVEYELTNIRVAVRAVEDKEKDVFLHTRDIIYKLDKLIAILRRIQDRECSEKQGDVK